LDLKLKILSAFIFLSIACFAKVPSINEVRIIYQKATASEKSCKELIDLLFPYTDKNNPLLFGYKGVATMLMAKHVFFPFSKLYYFNKGKKMLDRAIDADAENVELRFLRFTIQTNVPTFLGYSDNIKKDKVFILNLFSSIKDPLLKNIMLPVLQKSDYLTTHEKQQL
jgi:hypothetical protein